MTMLDLLATEANERFVEFSHLKNFNFDVLIIIFHLFFITICYSFFLLFMKYQFFRYKMELCYTVWQPNWKSQQKWNDVNFVIQTIKSSMTMMPMANVSNEMQTKEIRREITYLNVNDSYISSQRHITMHTRSVDETQSQRRCKAMPKTNQMKKTKNKNVKLVWIDFSALYRVGALSRREKWCTLN